MKCSHMIKLAIFNYICRNYIMPFEISLHQTFELLIKSGGHYVKTINQHQIVLDDSLHK